MPQSPAGRAHHQQVHTSRTGIPPGWLLELARLNQRSWVVWLSDLSLYWHILLQQGTGRSRSNWRICCQKRRKKCTIKKTLWLLCFTRKLSRLTTVFRKKETCRLTDKTIMRSSYKYGKTFSSAPENSWRWWPWKSNIDKEKLSLSVFCTILFTPYTPPHSDKLALWCTRNSPLLQPRAESTVSSTLEV